MSQAIDILVLRESVQNITQILAGRGIAVTQRGSRAYVESDRSGRPLRVNLPYIPDEASPDLIAAIQGFLDHEVGHLLFTDFTVIAEAARRGQRYSGLLNVVEDPRIERQMGKRFPGSGHNLGNVQRFFLSRYTQPIFEKMIAEGADAGKIAGVLMVPAIRSWSGQDGFTAFMREGDRWRFVEDFRTKVGDELISALPSLDSTREAFDWTIAAVEKLKAHESKTKSKTPPPPEEEPEEGEPEESKEGEPGSMPGKGSESEEEEPEEEEPSSAPGKSHESEGGESGGLETPGEEGEEGEKGEEGEEGEKGVESEEGSGASGGDISEILDEIGEDFDSAIARMLTEESDPTGHGYLPYTKDFDVIEPLDLDGRTYDSEVARMEDETMHMVGVLQKNLERLMVARSQSHWQPGQRSGRLNSGALYRLKTGDTRVFRNRHEGESKDVAVSLVVDCSGSMSGSRIRLASISAFAIASVLERLGITYEVVGFTTQRVPSELNADLKAEAERGSEQRYSRIEPIYIPILKSFSDRLGILEKRRVAAVANFGRGEFLLNNIDGESVQYAARRLMGRPEAGKYMMVLSDGRPACQGSGAALDAHLRQVVKDLIGAGINMIGIGIESAAVKRYYPTHVVLNSADELPSQVMRQLSNILLSKK